MHFDTIDDDLSGGVLPDPIKFPRVFDGTWASRQARHKLGSGFLRHKWKGRFGLPSNWKGTQGLLVTFPVACWRWWSHGRVLTRITGGKRWDGSSYHENRGRYGNERHGRSLYGCSFLLFQVKKPGDFVTLIVRFQQPGSSGQRGFRALTVLRVRLRLPGAKP